MQFVWVQTHIQFSVVSGPKFTGLFLLNAGRIAGDHLSFRFWISWPLPEIFAIQVWSCLKSRQILHVFGPQFLWGEGPPNFWTCIIKNTNIAIMWQGFVAIGWRSLEVAWRKKTSRVKHKAFGTNVPGGLTRQWQWQWCLFHTCDQWQSNR